MPEQTTDTETVESTPNPDAKFTQADFDRFAADAKRKAKEEAKKMLDESLAAEKERLAKEAHDRELLEKENFKELAEQRHAEAEKLRAELAARDRASQVTSLLDKHEIQDPHIRAALTRYQPTDPAKALDELDAVAANIKASVTALAENIVAKRLNLKAPENGPGAPGGGRILDMDIDQRSEYREKIGDAAYAKQFAAEKKRQGIGI